MYRSLNCIVGRILSFIARDSSCQDGLLDNTTGGPVEGNVAEEDGRNELAIDDFDPFDREQYDWVIIEVPSDVSSDELPDILERGESSHRADTGGRWFSEDRER